MSNSFSLKRSRELFEAISKIVPGGVHSNFRYFEPHPIYFARAEGSRIWDIDGNEYIDCVVNNGALILGHGHPKVVEAVKEYLEIGLTAGVESELSYKVSKLITEMVPSAEMVRFSNTGTEAIMHALMIARGYTGRDKIVKVEGGYDGWYDQVAISDHPPLDKAGPESSPNSVPSTRGLLRGIEEKTIVIPYNNIDVAERILKDYREEVAALLIEPIAYNMGTVTPKNGYLKAVREITEKNNILLIFDEVISGFRVAPGGAQQYYNITPDLSVFAKAIANGFPLAAVAGKEEFMKITVPGGGVAYAGTYNGHQVSLAAASATLTELRDGSVQRYLGNMTDRIVRDVSRIAEDLGVKARVQGVGGQFHIYFTDSEVTNYRETQRSNPERYSKFRSQMLSRGVFLVPYTIFHHGITSSHSPEDIQRIVDSAQASLQNLAS